MSLDSRLTVLGLLALPLLVACGGERNGHDGEASLLGTTTAPAPVRKVVPVSIPLGASARPGELEPQCKAAIRYVFAVVKEAQLAVKEYCDRRGSGCLQSEVTTRDPIKLNLGLEFSSENSSSTTIDDGSTSTTNEFTGKIEITVGVEVPLGPQTVTTVIPASGTAEMQAFISPYFENSATLDGVFRSCPGLGGGQR